MITPVDAFMHQINRENGAEGWAYIEASVN